MRHIPFYYYDDRVAAVPALADFDRLPALFSSGRNSCDWGTLIAAAEGQGWDLTIVSSTSDWERYHAEAEAAGIRMIHEIPRAQHDEMLDRAGIFVMALRSARSVRATSDVMSSATRGSAGDRIPREGR